MRFINVSSDLDLRLPLAYASSWLLSHHARLVQSRQVLSTDSALQSFSVLFIYIIMEVVEPIGQSLFSLIGIQVAMV